MPIKLSTKERNSLFEEIKDYYAKDGVYEEFFAPNHLTDSEILKGIDEYLNIIDEKSWGGGDSIDRENVKWIMMSNRHDKIKKQIKILKEELKKYPKLKDKSFKNLVAECFKCD